MTLVAPIEETRLCGAGVLPYGKGRDGQLQLLLGRERFCRRGGSEQGAWSPFSGKVNGPTETATACAAREFVEETLAVVPLNRGGRNGDALTLTDVSDVERYLSTLGPRHIYRYTIPTRAGLGVHVHYLCPIPLYDYDVVFETVRTTLQRLRHLSCGHRQALQALSSTLFGYTIGRRATHTVVDIEVFDTPPTNVHEDDPNVPTTILWQHISHVHPPDKIEHENGAFTNNVRALYLRVARMNNAGEDIGSKYYRLELTVSDAQMLTVYVQAWRTFHAEAVTLLDQHGLWNHPALLIQRAHTHILDLNLRPDFFEKTMIQWWPLQKIVALAANPHQRHLRAFFSLVLPALSSLLLQLAAWTPAVESDLFSRTSSEDSCSSSTEARSKPTVSEPQALPDSCFQVEGGASGHS